jgi:single-strand DNA-binding protein
MVGTKTSCQITEGKVMAGEAVISVTGNLGGDAELKKTTTGINVTSFSLAHTPRSLKNNEWVDGETIWFRCFVWGSEAPSAAAALRKGMRVVIDGRMSQNTWTTKEGETRVQLEINCDKYGIVPPKVIEPVEAPISKTTEDPVPDDFPW